MCCAYQSVSIATVSRSTFHRLTLGGSWYCVCVHTVIAHFIYTYIYRERERVRAERFRLITLRELPFLFANGIVGVFVFVFS